MTKLYDQWEKVPWDEARWPNFTAKEMACKGTGHVLFVPDFVDEMQELRRRCGFPLPINSWYRDPEYNAKVSTTGLAGPHTHGVACDIACSGERAYVVLMQAMNMGFFGIGVKQKGPYEGRFLHVDMIKGANRPRVWSY